MEIWYLYSLIEAFLKCLQVKVLARGGGTRHIYMCSIFNIGFFTMFHVLSFGKLSLYLSKGREVQIIIYYEVLNKFSLRRVISIWFAAVKRSCVIFLAFVVIVHGHVCCGCAAGERCCCCCLRRHYKLLHSGGIELNTHTHPYYQAAIFTHTHTHL